jgi:hypothetical protein
MFGISIIKTKELKSIKDEVSALRLRLKEDRSNLTYEELIVLHGKLKGELIDIAMRVNRINDYRPMVARAVGDYKKKK